MTGSTGDAPPTFPEPCEKWPAGVGQSLLPCSRSETIDRNVGFGLSDEVLAMVIRRNALRLFRLEGS